MFNYLQVPEDVIPEDVKDKVGDVVEQVQSNPELAAILIGVGVLTAAIFVWGIFRQAFKAAFIGLALSAGTWYWYFNVR